MAFGDPNYQASPVWNEQIQMPPQHPIAQAAMGSGKINWLGVLADALSGAAGRPGMYAASLAQQRQMQLEDAQYEHRQEAELSRQERQYDYQRTHPNDETTQLIIQSGVDPQSVQGKAMYAQALQARINPFTMVDVQQPDGSTQRQMMRPPMAPAAPVGDLSDTPPTQPAPMAQPAPVQGGPTPPRRAAFPKSKPKRVP